MEMHDELNVIICGVGGQGVILISEILGNAAVKEGFHVRGSEVHGMAARGGSVSSHVRVGKMILGPVTPIGKCDILIGMEPAEALRNISFLSPSSIVLLNSQITIPFTVSLGRSIYPEFEVIIDKVESSCKRLVALDAIQIAEEAGNALAVNIAMIGALNGTGRFPVAEATIKEEIRARFGAKAALNLRAFDLGCQACKDRLF